ncbi:methyltransferase domain-containing protein [Fulvimarina sp. MAC3]|uniref:class I SAM-dependent methyltransferase n=1 Tax=Fulvimarina sp. MAC3 TaxID=3148887 RepID=UPI0031FC9A5B
MSLTGVVDQWRPETGAGGFSRDDEAVNFYTRINALARPDMVAVDLGAGRGERYQKGTSPYVRSLCNLQGKVRHLIGLDVDPVVRSHPCLDEAHVIDPTSPYPLEDESVDLVICEYVAEHVEHPEVFAREIGRILKPGGWFCAMTPNKYGYVGLGNLIVPPAVKDRLMRIVWPDRLPEDAFPTFYRLNTLGHFKKAFQPANWDHHSYTTAATPKYHANRSALFAAVGLYQALMPAPLQTNLMVYLRKKEQA